MSLKLLNAILSTLIFTTITFAANVDTDKAANKIVTCKDPRPQLCTMNYLPVCALNNNNQLKTYSNGCAACSDAKVLSYTARSCQDSSLKKFTLNGGLTKLPDSSQNRENALTRKDAWHAAKLHGVNYRAIGQEPSWLLEIIDGEHFYISNNYGELVKTYPYVEPKVNKAQRTKVYQLKNDVIIKIEVKGCIDVISGEEFSTRVSIKLHERTLTGCGKTLVTTP